MSVPLKTLLEVKDPAPCPRCGGPAARVQATFFATSFTGQTEEICLSCAYSSENNTVEIVTELEDLTPPAPSKRKVLRRQKKLSQKQEVGIADELNARTQKASGAMRHAKGDVRRKGVCRVEAKYTEASSYRLTLDELLKIASECVDREIPVLAIDYLQKGTGRQQGRYAVLRMTDLLEMLDAARNHR